MPYALIPYPVDPTDGPNETFIRCFDVQRRPRSPIPFRLLFRFDVIRDILSRKVGTVTLNRCPFSF